MKSRIKKALLIILLLFPLFSKAEGWKELSPYGTNLYIYIQKEVWGSTNPAVSDSARIHIHIKNTGEKIYYGFYCWLAQPPNMSLTYVRILSPTGTVLQQDTLVYQSTGWIVNYAQAAAGPNVINPAGYPGFEFTPPAPGDYLLDVGYGDPFMWSGRLDFDITVVDTTLTPWQAINGRVYCYSWSFQTQTGQGFYGTMFCYPTDSVVTSMYFNGLYPPNDLFLVMNRNGVFPPPEKWIISRMSQVSGQFLNNLPMEFKIFLNNPDSTIYPTGLLGQILPGSLTVTPNCNGDVDIGMTANKAGQVEIQVQIDPDSNIQPIDVMISDSVYPGQNTMTWNGINGLGEPVANGTPFYVKVKFLNGLTNMPFFLVSGCPDGFIVELQRPGGPTPLLYWDDRNIDTSKYNFMGCLSSKPSSGCHAWMGTPPYNNMNVINSWWYTSLGSLCSPPVLFKRSFSNSSDTTVCQGDTVWFHGQMFTTQGQQNVIFPTITGCDSTYTLNLTVKPGPPLNLGPDVSVCNGQSYTFDAGWCNTCTYQWADLTTSQMNIGNAQTYTTSTAGTYMCTKTDSTGCSGRDTVVLSAGLTPVITNPIRNFSICSGDTTNISLSASIPGTTFNWISSLVSGIVNGYSNSNGQVINQVLTNPGVVNGIVKYTVTPDNNGCIGDTAGFLVTVTPGDSVQVSINASTNSVCAGTLVTYTASPTNGGANAMYQWKVNGISIGGNSPVYSYNPLNGDIVTCTLTSSNLICTSNNPATSNQVIMVINSNLPVIVVISASQNPVCSNVPVTFTATPTNGGGAPQYQWKVNGINVGLNSPVYTYTPANGDVVICMLTSSEVCTSNNPATSIPVIMVINSNLPVIVVISASVNPVCAGTSVTFTATPTNGGLFPVYQWKVNGINVGTNSPTYTYTPASGDLVSCILTSSLQCTSSNPASSNPVSVSINAPPLVTFSRCNDTITTTNAKPFKLKGGIPLGGTYSGPGVNPATGIWNPAAAGVGIKTITYAYTNVALCIANTSRAFRVVAAPAFACGNLLNDVRDNEAYQTVQIGAQCWFSESLKYGTEIPDNLVQRDNCIPEKYSRHASPVTRYDFYQWDEIMQYSDIPGLQGLCPPAWHIPSEADWNQLFAVYNGPGFAGSHLLTTGFSGFNALVNGSRFQNSSWNFDNFAIHLWSSTAWGPVKAWAHAMNSAPDDHSVSTYPSSRSNAFSVRCIKD